MAKRNRERKARFDEKRPSARQRGYDTAWQRIRAEFLKAHPNCIICKEPATVVDHIEPHRGNLALFLNPANWQPVCGPCHNRKIQSLEKRGLK